MKVLHDWLSEYVGEQCPSVEKLDELFTFHAFEIDSIERVGDKDVIDVKVLPDRASDCLSHRGIARELSTLTGIPLEHDPLTKEIVLEPKTDAIKVSIENSENCRRFAGALIRNVEVKESPEWLKARLEALGQRSINTVVDATNYVMLAIGQPLHAYDADTFTANDGVWHFGIRMSQEGEEVTTLSGDTFTLKNDVQLITNGATDVPVGIAGIKGGKSAEISESTKNIILEAANFNPIVTRKGSQSLKLQTDASKRFENNLSPELVPFALTECVALILKIAGGNFEGYVDAFPHPIKNTPVPVTLSEINALLGVSLTSEIVEDIFTRLGLSYTKDKESWYVVAPFERTDIVIPEDVIAEVGRVYGYEHVESVIPKTVPLTEINTRHYYSEKIRSVLIAEGFSEVITSSFRKKDEIELLNALASDKGYLRSSLRKNLADVLDKNSTNIELLNISSVQVFEIGTVFHKTDDGGDVTEHVTLGIGVRTRKDGHNSKDDVRLKEVATRLETELGIEFNAEIEKGILELSLTDLLTKLPMPNSYEPFVKVNDIVFAPYSMYPFIVRDIAVWVPETTNAEELESILRGKGGELLIKLSLFDEFKKDGRVSYAFRLIFQSFDRTLTDEEVNVIMEDIYTELRRRSFEIR